MKKGGGSESTIIIGPSKSVLVYLLHSLEYVLGLARFRVFVPKLLLLIRIRTLYLKSDIMITILGRQLGLQLLACRKSMQISAAQAAIQKLQSQKFAESVSIRLSELLHDAAPDTDGNT